MPSTLSNCYIPLPIYTRGGDEAFNPNSSVPSFQFNANLRSSGDGLNTPRSSKALRRLVLQRSVLSASRGSSLVELGHTKVLCAVHGPRQMSTLDHGGVSGGGSALNCAIRYAPYFGLRPETKVLNMPTTLDGGGGSNIGTGTGTSEEEVELSSRLVDALSPALPLYLLSSSKCVLDVYCMVLQGDGSVLAACITAASLALADAGVEMYDLVSACSAAVLPSVNKTSMLVLDPSEEEIGIAEGIVTLALMKNWKEITFWGQVGRLKPETSSEALELCKDGCITMSKFMSQSLIDSTVVENK